MFRHRKPKGDWPFRSSATPIGEGTFRLSLYLLRTEGENSRDHWAAANGCDAVTEAVDPAPCTAFTGCDDGFPVTWCEHEIPDFLGHTWPSWAGPAIWKFFAQF